MEMTARYLNEVVNAAQRVDLRQVAKLVDRLEQAFRRGNAVFVIGNGGSAANASHFAQDLSKGAISDLEGKRFRVMSLTDNVPFITAIANDIGFERIFDLQLRQYASAGDILISISGSGRSPNILRAVEYARRRRVFVVGVTGFDGGTLKGLSNLHLHVPIRDMCKTEAVHAILLHMVADLLRARLGRVRR